MWLRILVFVTASRQEIWPPAVLNDYYTEQECQVHLAKPEPLRRWRCCISLLHTVHFGARHQSKSRTANPKAVANEFLALGLWAMICVRDPNYPGCALRPGQCAEIDAVEICVPPRWGGRR